MCKNWLSVSHTRARRVLFLPKGYGTLQIRNQVNLEYSRKESLNVFTKEKYKYYLLYLETRLFFSLLLITAIYKSHIFHFHTQIQTKLQKLYKTLQKRSSGVDIKTLWRLSIQQIFIRPHNMSRAL